MDDRSGRLLDQLQDGLHALYNRRATLDANREDLTTSRAARETQAALLGQLIAANENWGLELDSIEKELAKEGESIRADLRNLNAELEELRREHRDDRALEDDELKDVATDLAAFAGEVNPAAKKSTKRKK